VDIWVNSENTDMLMDRFFGRSVSATIRYLGASKHPNDTIYRDTIAEELRNKLGGQIFVRPGTVVVTGAGALRRRPHRVRRIFHAAAVQGVRGKNYIASADVSGESARNVLLQAEALNIGLRRFPGIRRLRRPFQSIVIPLLGAGQGQVTAAEIVVALVGAAVEFLERKGDSLLREIYFLAYRQEDLALLQAEIGRYAAKLEPIPNTRT
jgi:O-acetyl-ADP-ribose deacetylase (regulator of RNase III)